MNYGRYGPIFLNRSAIDIWGGLNFCVQVFCASRGILHSKTNPLNAIVSVYLCDNWESPLYISSTSIWRGFPWWELWSMRGFGIFFTKSWQSSNPLSHPGIPLSCLFNLFSLSHSSVSNATGHIPVFIFSHGKLQQPPNWVPDAHQNHRPHGSSGRFPRLGLWNKHTIPCSSH